MLQERIMRAAIALVLVCLSIVAPEPLIAGDISTMANSVFRDYVVDGVPSSGKWEPRKSEIRTWSALIDTITSAAGGFVSSPDYYGAAGNGITDDKAAFVSAAAALGGKGGIIQMGCSKAYYLSNLQLPAGVTLRGCLTMPDNPGGINTSQDYSLFGGIRLSGASASANATTTKGSAVVVVSSASGLVVGMGYDHPNVPGGAYITAINGTSVTLSAAATATSGATISACTINTINGSAYATLSGCTASTVGIAPAAIITASGVPGGAYVLGIDAYDNVIMSSAATATASGVSVSFANPATSTFIAYNSINLGPAAGVEKVLIYRAGLTFPVASENDYTGFALRCGYRADGCFVRDSLVIGFDWAFRSVGSTEYAFANSRIKIENLSFDARNGVLISGSADSSKILARGWPYGTVGNGNSASQARTGSCFMFRGQNDDTEIVDGFCNGHNRGADIERSSNITITNLSTDHQGQLLNSVGLYTGPNTALINVVNLKCFGNDVCVVRNAEDTSKMTIGTLTSWFTGHEAVRVNAGDLSIGNFEINKTGTIASSPAFALSCNTCFVRAKGIAAQVSSGYPVASSVQVQTDRVQIDVQVPDATAGTQIVGANPHVWPTVASADPLNLPYNGNEFYVSGTTSFSTIAGGNSGRTIRLHSQGALTLFAGSNLALPNNAHLALPASSWVDLEWNSSAAKWVLVNGGSESTSYWTPFPLARLDIENTFAARIIAAGAGNTWPTLDAGGAAWGPRDSWMYSKSGNGRIAIGGFSRSADTVSPYEDTIGVGGFAIADQAGMPGWGLYGDCQLEGGTQCYGLELAVKNKGANATSTPYFMTTGAYGIWLPGGGDNAYGGASTNPSNTAIAIGHGGNTWNRGIIFAANALTGDDGTTGTAVAIEMAKGHILSWRAPGNVQGASIRSDITGAGGSDFSQVFSDNKVTFYGSGGVLTALTINSVASAANYLTTTNAIAGAPPTIAVAGTDADIDIRLDPKGTGVVDFFYTATSSTCTHTKYLPVKVDGVSRKMMLCD